MSVFRHHPNDDDNYCLLHAILRDRATKSMSIGAYVTDDWSAEVTFAAFSIEYCRPRARDTHRSIHILMPKQSFVN